MTLNAVSLNIRGLNNQVKRRKLFRWLQQGKYDIIFLQETYSDESIENVWRKEWGGDIFFSHGSKHSKGVMTCFRPALDVVCVSKVTDKNGRSLIVNAIINQEELCLVNIYAPNDQNQQIDFINQLILSLRQVYCFKIVIGGDFNCPLSTADKLGGKSVELKKRVIQAIHDLCNTFDLTDVWREQHQTEVRFTWNNSSGKIKCRLDYWLISKQLLHLIQKSDIKAYYDSDHCPITIVIRPEDLKEGRGPGFWKFNNSLLEDNDFVSKLCFIIRHAKEKHKDTADKRLYWEMLKMEIRIFTIRYSKEKARKKKSRELDLLQELNRLNICIDQNPNDVDLFTKSKELKIELDKIAVHNTRGSIIRSRARWYEFGEKSNKYFLNMEKRNYNKRHIAKLKLSNGFITDDPKVIRTEMRNLYCDLYTSHVSLPDASASFLESQSLPVLDSDSQSKCEGLLTEEECLSALKSFAKNKTPGTDGLNAEFYQCFWNEISGPLVESLNVSATVGELSISQKRGIISLIPKKGKDPLNLKNWRPISLLNVDYKLATKCIAKRLEKVLPLLISEDQTGYIKGRFIGENIRLISDIIEKYQTEEKHGMIFFLDFEKAFDSLEWNYLCNVLKKMNFGPSFCKWIQTFYTNISSCVINNGYTSDFFSLHRGVRQGCPLSGLLFVLAVEPIAHQIRMCKEIQGLELGHKTAKLAMYADDTTAFIHDDHSATKLFCLLDHFSTFSGLKINKGKTEGLWLGSYKHRLGNGNPYGILWPLKYVISLGVAFAYDSSTANQINFDQQLSKLQKVLTHWSPRHLSIIGRITIVKTLALSKLVYVSSVLHVPDYIVKKANKDIFSFIWKSKPDKIKRRTLVAPISKGGLNMVNFYDVEKSLKAVWVNRICNAPDSTWSALVNSSLSKFGGTLLFQCNFDVKLLELKGLPYFYRKILSTWQELYCKEPQLTEEYKQEILWNNRFIRINGKSFYFKSWYNKGILKVQDLLDSQNQFLTFEDFKDRFGIRTTFLDYAGVIAAIPRTWKDILRSNMLPTQSQRDTPLVNNKVTTARKVRFLLAEKLFCPPIVEHYLKEQKLNPKDVYELPFKITIENKLRSFQFKLTHNLIPTNQLLFKMKIKASPKCERCESLNETLSHMFCECREVKEFWELVINWWNTKRSDSINPNQNEILYGYKPESPHSHALNHFLLIAKYYIYLSKIKMEPLNIKVFLPLLRSKIRSEQEIAVRNSAYSRYENKWTTLSNCSF